MIILNVGRGFKAHPVRMHKPYFCGKLKRYTRIAFKINRSESWLDDPNVVDLDNTSTYNRLGPWTKLTHGSDDLIKKLGLLIGAT